MTAVRRLLHIRPGEERTVGLMLAGFLLIWSGSAIGANGVESLLLTTVGPHVLPVLYMGLAAASLVVSLLVARWLRGVVSPRHLLRAVAASAVAVAGMRGLIELPPSTAYPAAWLAMMVVWTSTGLLLWAVAGSLHDTRQAKRLFPLYGAAIVFGVSSGGFLTPAFTGVIGVENLLVVWTLSLVLGCLVIGRVLPATAVSAATRRRRVRSEGAARAVQRSPLLRWMWVSLGTATFLYFALSLLFARGLAERFPDARNLAGFIGVFTGVASVSALAVSLLLANRLFAAFGIATVILVLPLIYAVGFDALAVAPSFALLVGFRLAQVVWVNGVWAGGWQALFNVVPTGRRDSVRAFLDATALQSGVAGAGLVALLAQREILPIDLAVLAGGVAVMSAFAGWRMRAAYAGALVEALREGDPEVFIAEEEPFGGFRRDRAALSVARDDASSPDPGARRIAIAVLAEAADQDALPLLREALDDEDRFVRARAIEALAWTGDRTVFERLTGLLHDDEPEVRRAVVRAIARSADPVVFETSLQEAMTDPDPAVRASAAGVLAVGPDPSRGVAVLEAMVSDERAEWRRAGLEAVETIGATVLPLVLRSLRDADPVVRAAAIDATVRIGEEAVEPLAAAVASGGDGAAAIALSRLRPAHPALGPYVRQRLTDATRYLRLARRLGSEGDRAIDLMVHSLRHAAFDAAVAGLSARASARDPDAIRLALENLGSKEAGQRANALETLEAAGDPALVRPFVAAWEGATEGDGTGPAEVLRELAEDQDPWIRECARFAATRQDGGVEALSRISVMERMVFLRKVSLFARLGPADLKHVAEATVESTFSDGEVIAEEGETGDELHILVDGEIRVLVGPGRSEVARRRAGEYVGEMAVISGEPRMAALVSAGPVRTLSLDRPRFERILRERPDVAIAAMRVLSERLRQAHALPGEAPVS